MNDFLTKAHTKLPDLFDPAHIQAVQDAFARLSGLLVVLVDPAGQAITKASGGAGFYKAMAETAQGRQLFHASTAAMVEAAAQNGQAAMGICPHSGLMTAALPLCLEGELLAVWFMGEARTSDVNDALLEATAQKTGLEAERLKKMVHDLPATDAAHFEAAFVLLQTLASSIVRLGQDRRGAAATSEELLETTRQLDNTAQMLRRFTDTTDVAFYICDYYTGELLMANERYLKSVGAASLEEALGKKCWELGGPGGSTFCSYCPRERLLQPDGTPSGPYRWENYNEKIKSWLRITNQAITWADGRLAQMVTLWDVTPEHEMREELARLAFYDRQMGLPNAVKLTQDLDAAHFRGQEEDCYLLSFDIVSLRRLNDAYGRDVVDVLLSTILDWIRAQPWPLVNLYRIGGDAFCLMLGDVTAVRAEQIAHEVAQRFQDTWQVPVNGAGAVVTMVCGASVSVVAATARKNEESLLSLIERTLEESRKEGGVVMYTREMDLRAKEHARLEMSLKNAVKNGMEGFAVHYQPIVDPAAGVWHGFEALCRWNSPEFGEVSPLVFIREAEQLGLIGEVGLWVLETALRQCKAWGLDGQAQFMLSVNLSPAQLVDGDLAAKVNALLRECAYPGEKLNLEITESTQATFEDFTLAIIDKLRFLGISISLDDFGTGYSSFNNLKNLPVRYLKTEREFIEGIEDDPYMQYFFYIMAELAHATDMRLIAEGVETRQQLEILLKNGADYVQGYYFSKPMPPEEAGKQLVNFTRVDPTFYALQTGPMELRDLLEGSDSYIITPRLFKIMNQCMQVLLSEPNLQVAFSEVMAMVGESLDIGRVYVYEKEEEPWFRYHFEWCAPGVTPLRRQPQMQGDLDRTREGWLDQLREKGLIVVGDVADLPEEMCRAMMDLEVKATAVLPMWADTEMVGFVGFDSERFRDWLPEEVMMLRNLAMVMGSSLRKDRLRREVEQKGIIFSDVMDQMGLAMFVSDLDTDEILWANKAMKEAYAFAGQIEGRPCHKVIAAEEERCTHCKIDTLLSNPAIKQCHWELRNPHTGRDIMVYDSLVHWEQGKKAHLQYALDITETKVAQRKMEYYANTDDLTGTLNRKSLHTALKALLLDARETGRPLSVVFLDFDNLKEANKTYGHVFGDRLLNGTVAAVRTVVRRGDVIGRYGYDEFVLLMTGCDATKAKRRVEAARKHLGGQRFAPSHESYSFSFGVVQNTEVPYSESEEHIKALLDLAEARMMEDRG